jgi:hypothetical protein
MPTPADPCRSPTWDWAMYLSLSFLVSLRLERLTTCRGGGRSWMCGWPRSQSASSQRIFSSLTIIGMWKRMPEPESARASCGLAGDLPGGSSHRGMLLHCWFRWCLRSGGGRLGWILLPLALAPEALRQGLRMEKSQSPRELIDLLGGRRALSCRLRSALGCWNPLQLIQGAEHRGRPSSAMAVRPSRGAAP